MMLSELVAETVVGDVQVHGITDDSRQVQPGDLFCAVQGEQHDGRQYIDDAVGRGAVAVVSDQPVTAGVAVPVVTG